MRLAAVVLVLALPAFLVSKAADKKCISPTPMDDPKFHAGQVWQYKTRPGEEDSFVTILRVESLGKKTIIHVRVDKVRLKNCAGGPEPDTIEHMPFAREAIESSVTKLLKEDSKIPDFRAGYDDWRNACGGVYTISIAEAVKADQLTFNQNLGCASNP